MKTVIKSLMVPIACVSIIFAADYGAEKFPVKESFFWLEVSVRSHMSPDITNETQSKAISREAAIALGQVNLLQHILEKKTRRYPSLAIAEEPSLELKQKVRGYIKGAKVVRTRWEKKSCYVTLRLHKKMLREILRNN